MCDDKAGAPKDVCKAEAKAAHTKARADAKLDDSIIDAKKDARADKANAEYKLAAVKCETLTGQQQEACINEAKLSVNKAKQPNAGATGAVDVKYVSPAAKLEADYKLAMDKCEKLAGEQQESCMTDTKIRFNKAPRTKVQLDAKARNAATEVKTLSPAEKVDADYKIATDKCKKLSGEQLDGCITTAKQRFNKT